jgi:hypothetical protein
MKTIVWKIPKLLIPAIAFSLSSSCFAADYYQPPTTFKLDGQNPHFGIVSDFNEDGIDDLAAVFPIPDKITGALTSARINFLVGNLAGTMKIETSFPLPFNVLSMATGDFNGDGQPDLAITPDKAVGITDPYCGTQKGVIIFFGFHNETQPDLQFASCVLNTTADELWTLDANSDNLADLIVGNQLLLSNGDGSFSVSGSVPSGDKMIADINGDNQPDIITDHQGLCSDGNGVMSPCPLPPNDPLVNTDQNGDIVTSNSGFSINSIASYLYNCPSCWGRNKAAIPISQQASADIDGDGISDLVGAVVTTLEHPIISYYSKCGWSYQSVNIYRPGAGRGRSRSGGSYYRGKKWLYSCRTSRYYTAGSTFHSVTQNEPIPGMSALRISLMRPDGSIEQILGPEVHGYFRRIQVADVNDDGFPDVLADIAKIGNDGRLLPHPDYPGWVVFPGNGDGSFSSPEPTGLAQSAVIPGDFNGDGLTDFGSYITPFDSEHLLSVAFHQPAITTTSPAPDILSPTIVFTAPSDGGTVSGLVQLSVNASDNTGVVNVAFLLAGNTIAQINTAPYQVSWDTTNLVPGNYTLQAVATDAAGNSGTTTIAVTVDAPQNTSTPSNTSTQSSLSTSAQPTGNQLEFSGTVSEVGTNYFVIDGSLKVTIGASSVLKYQDGFGPAPSVGDPVQGKADEYNDGSHVAVKAEFG